MILSYYIGYSHGLTENIAKVIFKHLLQFIQFCLSKNIYYFDINPSNIIFDNQNKIKIIDYGNAHFFQNQNMIFNKDYCKNEFKSPEMWEKNEFKGEKSIIFILGAFLFNLVTGKYGFQKSEKNDKLYKLIINGANDNYVKYWEQIGKLNNNKNFSDNFKNLYINMVQYNPEDRPDDINEILQNIWFQEIDNNFENNIRNELNNLYNDIRVFFFQEINIAEVMNSIGYNTRSSPNDKQKFFVEQKTIKINKNRLSVNNLFIKINGKLNEVDFMNDLADKIIIKYKNNYIEEDKIFLKMEVTLEEEEKKEEKEKEDENNKDCCMNIQLLEHEKDRYYLLEFIRTKGEIEDYYKYFLEIKKIILNEILKGIILLKKNSN